MAKKFAFLMIGPTLPAPDELIDELENRSGILADADLALPAVSQADVFRSELEILRSHKTEGLRRKDVEGSWARICRKAEKTGRDVVIAHPGYAAATPSQVNLLLDGLAGFRTHVIITAPKGAPGLDDLIDVWAAVLKPSRLHVLRVAEDDGVDLVLAKLLELVLEARTHRLEKRIAKLKDADDEQEQHKLARLKARLKKLTPA